MDGFVRLLLSSDTANSSQASVCLFPTSDPQCGVRVEFLLKFAEALPEAWSSQDVLEHAILPETQKYRCR